MKLTKYSQMSRLLSQATRLSVYKLCYALLFFHPLFQSLTEFSLVRRPVPGPGERALAAGHRRAEHPEHLRGLQPVGGQRAEEEDQVQAEEGPGELVQQFQLGRPQLGHTG